MGQKLSTLATAKEQHKGNWNNYKIETNDVVKHLREIYCSTSDNVLRGNTGDLYTELKDYVTAVFSENNFIASKMKEKAVQDVSSIASIVFPLRQAGKKEIRHSFKRSHFEYEDEEMCSVLLITYVASEVRSRFKFDFILTYAVYQRSLPIMPQGQHETGSPDQMSDISSIRNSTTSSTSVYTNISPSLTAPSRFSQQNLRDAGTENQNKKRLGRNDSRASRKELL